MGFAPDFWAETPRTFDVRLRGRVKALTHERRARLLQAYQIAALAGFRSKMPSWASVEKAWGLAPPKTRQTPAEIRAVMDQWRAVSSAVSAARKRKP